MDARTIIWDFNGTLLNDVDICVESVNHILTKRNLPEIDISTYLERFSFPVVDFYKTLGFDFSQEPFEKSAFEYISYYKKENYRAKLFPEIIGLLKLAKERGYKQTVLSAMEEESLKKMLSDLGIIEYFDYVAGIDNHLAAGKIERGIRMITENSINKHNAILIGDTIHDAEVAEELGIKSILVAKGHYSKKRLSINNNTVLNNHSELTNILNSQN